VIFTILQYNHKLLCNNIGLLYIRIVGGGREYHNTRCLWAGVAVIQSTFIKLGSNLSLMDGNSWMIMNEFKYKDDNEFKYVNNEFKYKEL